MKKILPLLAVCSIQFIFSVSVFAQKLELTPTIQSHASGNKSAAIVKKQSKEAKIGNVISKGNILKSGTINPINYLWGNNMSTSDNDRYYKTTIDVNGNTIAVGSKGESSSDYDAIINKFDSWGYLLWSHSPAISSNIDEIYDVITDKEGNVYITGKFYSSAFNSEIYSNGGSDIFIAKYDPDGNLLWAKNAGGYDDDYGCGIGLDENNNVYVVGFYNGTAYWDGISKTSWTQGNMFIAKYDYNGNAKWVRNGTVGSSSLLTIGVDKTGNTYVGYHFTGSVQFDGAPLVMSSGGTDIFLIKYDTSGNFSWIKTAGGIGDDGGNKTVIDPDGDILVAGYFSDVAQFENKTLTAHGSFDIFAAKYSPSGDLIWAKQFGGTGSQSAWGVCTDEKSNCYLTGWFSGTGAFDNTTIVSEGCSDAYLIKYDKNGNLIWVEPTATGSDKQVGTDVFVKGNDIAISGYYEGEMYIQNNYFPNEGGEDAYIAKLVQEPDAQKTVYVNPNLLLSAPHVNTGQSITFTGKQFSPAGKIDLNFTGPGILNSITDYTVDVYGNFEYTIYIPSSQTAGKYQVTVTDKISGLSTSKIFEVIQNQSTVVDDYLRIIEPNMSKIRLVGDPITLAWEDQVKYNVNPLYNFKHSYKVEYKRDTDISSGAWQLIKDVNGSNPGYGRINESTSFTPTDAGTYIFRITDNYYPNRSVSTPDLVVSGSLDQDIRVEFKWDYNSKWIGASPEGVAADGVARFYVVVSNSNVAGSPIQKVKLTLSDPDGYMAPQFLGKVMYCSIQSDDKFSTEANDANSITAENNSSNIDGNYWFWYVAPDDFSRNEGDWDKGERLISANIEVTLLNGKSLSSVQKEIKIARPPLMLVHGLNGDITTWNKFATGNGNTLFIYDPRFKVKKAIVLEPTSHFSVNSSILLAESNDERSFKWFINEMQIKGYACNQIDYVCHSMGGSVLRYASEMPAFYGSWNYGKGYVNKFITLDTPHNGSSFANFLCDVDLSNDKGDRKIQKLGKFANLFSYSNDEYTVVDAVKDLRYKDGVKFNKTQIPSHLIGCDVSCSDYNLKTKGLLMILATLSPKLNPFDLCGSFDN